MNPVLKSHVYKKGNILQLRFIAAMTGMSLDERKMLLLYHFGKSDFDVETKLGINKSTREDLENSLSTKISIGVMMCIDKAMDIVDISEMVEDPIDIRKLLEA